MQIAGIVLCGGLSSRMGTAKAWLPFGSETLLQRAVGVVSQATNPVIVVTAQHQELPSLPAAILHATDRHAACGPLEGLHAGLSLLSDAAHAAFACGCDTPFLTTAYIEFVARCLGDHDVAAPHIDGFYHPLAAVYRARIIPQIEALLAVDQRRVSDLFAKIRTRRISAAELRSIDPALACLRNVNTPEEYQAALREAGQGSARG